MTTASTAVPTTGLILAIDLGKYNNQLDEFRGYSSGDTIILASDSVHDTLNFANTLLTNIARVESGAGDDIVTTSLHNRNAALTYDGGSYSGDQLRLAVAAQEAIDHAAAIAADIAAIQAAILSGWSGGPLALSFFKFSVINFESVMLLVI